MNCPSLTELCAENAEAMFADHLAHCVRCRALRARLDASEQRVDVASLKQPPGTTRQPRDREVWALWAPDCDEYLVAAILESDQEQALVLPLLQWGKWATEADFELTSDVLGYRAIAALWAVDHVLAEQVVEAVDVLSETLFSEIRTAIQAFEASDEVPATTGPPIVGEHDPRRDTQAAMAEDLRRWYRPWADLQHAEELGPVIAARRKELQIEPEALTDEVGVDANAWLAFEEGKVDPYETVPAKMMAAAIERLGLLAGRRVVSLAKASVLAHHKGQDTSGGRAFARRMRGTTTASRRDPAVSSAAAESYGEALAKALGL